MYARNARVTFLRLKLAWFAVGVSHDLGYGTERDTARAALCYLRAAKQGHADSINNVGWSFQHGEGFEKNLPMAAACYRRAANLGKPKAENNLRLLMNSSTFKPSQTIALAK